MKQGSPKKAPKVAAPSKSKPNYMKEYKPGDFKQPTKNK